MIKIVFLVNEDLVPRDLVEQEALEIFANSSKELVPDASGEEGKFLVSVELEQIEADIILLAAKDESFPIQKTEYAIVEV